MVGARAALLPTDRPVEGLLEGLRGQSRLTAVRSITLVVSAYGPSLGSTAHEGIGKLFAHAHPPPVAQAAAKDGKRLKELLEHDRQQGSGADLPDLRRSVDDR
jgi:hypothetical protein